MKNLVTICLVVFVVSSISVAANTSYKFSFTGADLMSYVTADGVDGSTPVDNGLFDGARLVRDPAPDFTRSYVGSQNTDFDSWATTTTDKFIGFNMWGLDGRGAKWGEDFKPQSWGDTTQSSGWTKWSTPWPWGNPPAGYITDEIVGWDADTYGDAMGFGDADLASKEFSFVLNFDTDDMFWGAETQGAPNVLPELTFWFGGWMANGNAGDQIDWNAPMYMYEGNMVLTGQAVPVPGAFLLGGIGTACVGWMRRRRTL